MAQFFCLQDVDSNFAPQHASQIKITEALMCRTHRPMADYFLTKYLC